ncbi:hypothetical protein KM043_004475 [Ampulex compressa]|nr:hypothetical protein KM043_004475 [Ampulex compressa]
MRAANARACCLATRLDSTLIDYYCKIEGLTGGSSCWKKRKWWRRIICEVKTLDFVEPQDLKDSRRKIEILPRRGLRFERASVPPIALSVALCRNTEFEGARISVKRSAAPASRGICSRPASQSTSWIERKPEVRRRDAKVGKGRNGSRRKRLLARPERQEERAALERGSVSASRNTPCPRSFPPFLSLWPPPNDRTLETSRVILATLALVSPSWGISDGLPPPDTFWHGSRNAHPGINGFQKERPGRRSKAVDEMRYAFKR